MHLARPSPPFFILFPVCSRGRPGTEATPCFSRIYTRIALYFYAAFATSFTGNGHSLIIDMCLLWLVLHAATAAALPGSAVFGHDPLLPLRPDMFRHLTK